MPLRKTISGTLSAPSFWKISVLALTRPSTSSLSEALAVMPPPLFSTEASFSVIAATGSAAERMVAPCGSDCGRSRPMGIHTIFSLPSSGCALFHRWAQ